MWIYEDMMINHDWRRSIADGIELAKDQVRKGSTLKDRDVIWALLREACYVSRVAYKAPPRSGFPRKTSLPDGPESVSHWQLMSAYLAGDLDHAPKAKSTPPMPSSFQIDRAEVMLEVWHQFALVDASMKLKKAVYSRANGRTPAQVHAVTGISKARLSKAKDHAADDMWKEIRKY